MASIEEEMRQSRQAAEEITTVPDKESKERAERIRAEMMARYSGGKQGPLDFTKEGAPLKLFGTFVGNNMGAEEVFTGGVSPREYFSKHPGSVNYTGIGKILDRADGFSQEREALKVTDYAKRFKNDFISALYNGETPLEELGVADITPETRDVYRRILGEKYANVTGEKFRGYQLANEELPFAAELDNMVRTGNYTQKRRGYSQEAESDWALKGGSHFYDAGTHQRVVVEYNGKKYYKLVDVFDTAGTSKLPVAKGINEYIARHEIPYVVSTPWREFPVWRVK